MRAILFASLLVLLLLALPAAGATCHFCSVPEELRFVLDYVHHLLS